MTAHGGRVAYLFLAATAVATGVFFLMPSTPALDSTFPPLLHLALMVAMVAGFLRHRPARASPWLFLIAGMTCYLVADVVWYRSWSGVGQPLPFPSFVDFLYLLAYGAIVVGLGALVLAGGNAARGTLVDVVILTLGLGALSWVFLMYPQIHDTSMPMAAKMVALAYPSMDLLLFVAAAALLFVRGTRSPAAQALMLYVAMQLFADVWYSISLLHGTFAVRGPATAAWMLSYGFLGAAFLHPSMGALSAPSERRRYSGRWRLPFLAAAALLPILVLGYSDILTDDRHSQPVLVLIAVATLVLTFVRLSGLMVDIERYQAAQLALQQSKQALVQQRAELERSNADLQQFAYVASHDLQEPLRMVASYVQLLGKHYRGRLDEDADEMIEYAVDGAKRMQELINGLLLYARVDSKDGHFEQVGLDDVATDAVRNLGAHIAETGASVRLEPLPVVWADRTQMLQLLQNLIGNGLKFHGAGNPTVRVGARREGGGWVLEVEDDGIGIEPQHRDRIFDIFRRLHSRSEYAGTGIGLALCKRIAERHGGSIRVESVPGHGSTFLVSLPATQQAEAA